jgi:hypothetical protein
MFFFRHPKPVVDGRAVAVQVVQQKAARTQAATVLVAADSRSEPASAPASAGMDAQLKDQ